VPKFVVAVAAVASTVPPAQTNTNAIPNARPRVRKA